MGAAKGITLQVYVKQGCDSCERARKIAEQADAEFPNLDVEVVDVSAANAEREEVFAVPTFVLDDRILSLGNPQESQLHDEISALLRARGLV